MLGFGESRRQDVSVRYRIVIQLFVTLCFRCVWSVSACSSTRQYIGIFCLPFRSAQKPLINWKAVHGGREDDLKMKFGDLPPISKDFYTEHPLVSSRSSSEAEDFRCS